MLALAIADAFNPATIITMMVIMPIVKKKWHSLIFVFGTFLVYLIAGLTAFIGADRYLKAFLLLVIEKFSWQVGIIQIMTAGVLILFGVVRAVKLVRRLDKNEANVKDYMATVVKMVNPAALSILAISSTLMDMPTAIPYFGFIGILSAANTGFLVTVVLFVLYCFIYVLPMIILYLTFALIQGDRFNKIESSFKNFINMAAEYLIPVMLLVIGILLITDGIGRISSL